jgi:tetratricopeptide (TPR) repeat protein
MSESFPELLEERLKNPALNILGREERLLAFERIGIPYVSSLSKASLIKIAEELDAELLVLGEFTSDGKQIDVSASVLELRKGVLRPLIRESGLLDHFQQVCGRLGFKIVKQTEPTFSVGMDPYLQGFVEIPNGALESYVRGLIESDRNSQIRLFRQAAKLYPNYAKAIFQLGKVYNQEKDYATSSLWLQRLIRLDGEILEARFLLGLNYLYLRNYDLAISEFQKLSQAVPLNEVFSNLGIALSLKGSNESARDALQKSIDGDPNEADFHFNLGYHLWRSGDFSGALANLNRVIATSEADADAYYLIYKCNQALGKVGEAAEALSLAKQTSQKIEGWENRKQIPDLFRVQSNFDQATFRQLQVQIRQVEESRTIPKAKQISSVPELQRASMYMNAGRWNEAEQVLAQVIQSMPDSAEARFLMGRVLEAKGQEEKAISEFRTSVWLKESTQARVCLALLYLRMDRKKEALAQVRTVLELEPNNKDAQQLLTKLTETGQAR